MSNFDNPSMEGMAPEPVSLPESEPQVAQKAGRIARALSRLQRNNESSGVPVQYPVAPRHHEVLGYNEQGNELGLDYLNHLFPDETFSTLSSEGSSAVVYEDENSRVYKVMRDYTPYSYYEDEMAGLTLLHNEGLAPKPIIFIDAAEQFRLEREEGYAKHYFQDVPIRRQNGGGRLPVIVMEKVAIGDIWTGLSDSELISEFDRVVDIARRNDLSFGDVECVLDINTKKVQVIDAGGLSRRVSRDKLTINMSTGEEKDRYPNLTYEQFKESSLMWEVMHQLAQPAVTVSDTAATMHDILQQSGIDGIHQKILAARHQPAE